MSQLRGLLACLVVFFAGCSLVEKEELKIEVEEHTTVEATSPGPDAPGSSVGEPSLDQSDQSHGVARVRPAQVHLSWLENGEFPLPGLKRDLELVENHHYLSRTPLIVPHTIPGEFLLLIELPIPMEQVRTAEVNGQVGEEGPVIRLNEVELTLQNPESEQDRKIRIHVRGLNQLFSNFAENQAFINVLLRGESARLGSVRIPVMTPPTQLISEQMTVANYAGTPGAINLSQNKSFRTIDHKLSLLQVIKLRNPFPFTVIANFPLQPQGSLSTHNRQINLNQQPCTYSTSERAWDETISDQFFIIPLTEEMRLGFIHFTNEHINTGRFDQVIPPGGTVLLGIYAVGDAAATLMRDGHPIQRMSVVQAVSSCRSRCGDPRTDMYNFDSMGHASRYWPTVGWPGESRTCDSLRPTGRMMDPSAAHPDEDAMNRCALWELSNGLAPWDTHRYCQSPAPGNQWGYPHREFWNVTRQHASVTVGTESSPVRLRLQQESGVVHLRYSLPEMQEDTPSRPIHNLIQTQSEQFP